MNYSMKKKPIDKLFYKHLQQKSYVIETVSYYSRNAYYYKNWLSSKGISLKEARYTNLMEYVAYLQSTGKSSVMINKHLKSIELYYDYLQLPNIAHTVRLKNTKKHARLFLTEKELDQLYHTYQTSTTTYLKHTNKLLLGLTIYQGLEIQELLTLEKTDVNLGQGILQIRAGKFLKNDRKLELKAHQIIPLQQYITNHRKPSEAELLFLPQALYKHRLKYQLGTIHLELKELAKTTDISYKSLQQLRQSRIVQWIKHYGLRQAQYLSGHKGITSIERYQKQDLEDLSKQVQQYHPLG